jgi:hypothetical protein
MSSPSMARDATRPTIAALRRASLPYGAVIVCSLALLGVSVAHSLEDFVYGIPARFHLSVIDAALLLGAAYIVQVSCLLLATLRARIGYLLTGLTGAAWAIAAAVDHLGEVLHVAPYRAGIVSKALEVGIIVMGVLLAAASTWALGATRTQRL